MVLNAQPQLIRGALNAQLAASVTRLRPPAAEGRPPPRARWLDERLHKARPGGDDGQRASRTALGGLYGDLTRVAHPKCNARKANVTRRAGRHEQQIANQVTTETQG